jgi:GT2 family glycosyltransferase
MAKYQTIAVLLTCHNRRETTLKCLESLFQNTIPDNISLNVYLVDDGSTDGTSEAVKQKFPDVHVIKGDGNLYWNQGMRLAWETAAKNKEYDFYLWLNDDTQMDSFALSELLSCFYETRELESNESIIVGSCRNDLVSDNFSYGGRINDTPVIPNGSIQKCNYINGNLVLVPKAIFETIGNLSPHFTHAVGDNDYGLRALRAGFYCCTTRKYVATCRTNGLADWCNPQIPIIKRFENLYSPKGLNIREYIAFLKMHKKDRWLISTVKVYMKALFPSVYNYISPKG